MLTHPQPDPVAFTIPLPGSWDLGVHWYGLMYLLGFAAALWLGHRRAKQAWRNWNGEQVDDLVFYAAMGVIIGGRVGYMLFYDLAHFLENPLSLFMLSRGGMSFHGGFLGVLVAMWLLARKHGKAYWDVVDFVAPLVPPGLFTGRIGNFINGELPGRPADPDLWWSMVYPQVDAIARHPSALYQALTEGIVLFLLVWIFSRRPRPRYATSGVFALGYGCFRFTTEFFRTPDAHIGFVAFGWLTMGQLLCIPMILVGIFMLWLAYRKRIMPVLAGEAGK
ncbi:MAG: prolipoprotein diacylglyceryl transferase [Pseudomonadota bacterium]